MKHTFCTAILAAGAIVTAAGFVAPAMALGVHGSPYAARNDDRALTQIETARSELRAGNRMQAMDRIERAETALMNAQAAGDQIAPGALDAVRTARTEVREHRGGEAFAALDRAAGMLRAG